MRQPLNRGMLEQGELWVPPAVLGRPAVLRAAPDGPAVGLAEWLPAGLFASAVLEVREYDEAPLLFHARRAWTFRRRYHVLDAEETHVGSVERDALLTGIGRTIAWRVVTGAQAAYRLLDGLLLATESRHAGGRQVRFGTDGETHNPFLRMLVLAAALVF